MSTLMRSAIHFAIAIQELKVEPYHSSEAKKYNPQRIQDTDYLWKVSVERFEIGGSCPKEVIAYQLLENEDLRIVEVAKANNDKMARLINSWKKGVLQELGSTGKDRLEELVFSTKSS